MVAGALRPPAIGLAPPPLPLRSGPAPRVQPVRASRKAREIVVPLTLDAQDLENGITVRLALHVSSAEEEENLESEEAA